MLHFYDNRKKGTRWLGIRRWSSTITTRNSHRTWSCHTSRKAKEKTFVVSSLRAMKISKSSFWELKEMRCTTVLSKRTTLPVGIKSMRKNILPPASMSKESAAALKVRSGYQTRSLEILHFYDSREKRNNLRKNRSYEPSEENFPCVDERLLANTLKKTKLLYTKSINRKNFSRHKSLQLAKCLLKTRKLISG